MIQEILKNNGLNEDQITNILNSMKEAKVYTTKHENIDERYNKLKTQKTELEEKIKIQGETIKSFEGGLTKEEAEALKKDNDAKMEAQALSFKREQATNKLFDEYKFSSERARKGALLDFNEAGLEFDGENWVGGKEFLEEMKKSDPKAFDIEIPNNTGGLGNFGRSGTSEDDAFLKAFKEN